MECLRSEGVIGIDFVPPISHAFMNPNRAPSYSYAEISRIIEMAWEDRTSFEAIRLQFGLTPGQVIQLMRRELKPSSFRMWRARTAGRRTKHVELRGF